MQRKIIVRFGRYREFRTRTEEKSAMLWVPCLVYLFLCVRVVCTHMPFLELV